MHHDTPQAPRAPVIRFRAEQYGRHCAAAGLTTGAKQAKHTGLSKWTISRLISGSTAPGEHVIACMLASFPALRFDDLFEVVVAPSAPSVPAKVA